MTPAISRWRSVEKLPLATLDKELAAAAQAPKM